MCAFWHGKCWQCLNVKVAIGGSLCDSCEDDFILIGIETDIEFLTRIRNRTNLKMQAMVDQGLFAGMEEDGTPIPHLRVFSIATMEAGATMANVVVEMGLFLSLTQARKNGWNKPLQLGQHIIHKKTKLAVMIVD